MTIRIANLAVATAAATLLAVAGCSSTRTQKSAGEVIDDAVLTGKVKTALIDDKTVKALDVNVETRRGVVQLNGFANSQEEIDRAIAVARGITGVKSVDNNLTIKKP